MDAATVLDQAGYDDIKELQAELKEQQETYSTASGNKKVLAKRDLDEQLDVLAQYKAARQSSEATAADQV